MPARLAIVAAARHVLPRPARARALARLARLAARGPAPRSRTAPSRERCVGCRHGSHSNRAAVSRRAAYASPRASNLTSATMVTYLLTYLLTYL